MDGWMGRGRGKKNKIIYPITGNNLSSSICIVAYTNLYTVCTRIIIMLQASVLQHNNIITRGVLLLTLCERSATGVNDMYKYIYIVETLSRVKLYVNIYYYCKNAFITI